MSRTSGGWAFLCKHCRCYHLIPYICINEDSKMDVNIRIKCSTTHEEHTYTREDFQVWHGLWWTYVNNVVEPLSVKKVRRKK